MQWSRSLRIEVMSESDKDSKNETDGIKMANTADDSMSCSSSLDYRLAGIHLITTRV